MKRLMDKEDPKQIIRNFYIIRDNNTIVIEFLDGTKHTIVLNEENLSFVRKEMEKQSSERIGKQNSEGLYTKKRKHYIALSIVEPCLAALQFTFYQENNDKFDFIVGCGWLILSILNVINAVDAQSKLNEIKKYQIFNNIKGEIKKYCQDKNLFQGVTRRCDEIEDVDYVSLKEMRRIRTNLSRIKYFSGDEK